LTCDSLLRRKETGDISSYVSSYPTLEPADGQDLSLALSSSPYKEGAFLLPKIIAEVGLL
jgi:hypothetical protein